MDYGNKWEPGILPDELKNTYGEKIKGYYKWKLKTYAADYAHVFSNRRLQPHSALVSHSSDFSKLTSTPFPFSY